MKYESTYLVVVHNIEKYGWHLFDTYYHYLEYSDRFLYTALSCSGNKTINVDWPTISTKYYNKKEKRLSYFPLSGEITFYFNWFNYNTIYILYTAL